MSITKKLCLNAAAAVAVAVTATSGLAVSPAAAVSAAPVVGETVTVTLRIRPETPRGFVDSFGVDVIGAGGLSHGSSCDYLEAGPITVKTVTAQVGEKISIMPTAGCYLLTNASQTYSVTADTTVIDVKLPAVH